MTVWKTVSPKASTTRLNTSRQCTVRASYIVARIPEISSSGLSRSLTFSMVSTSRATPRSEKNSHSSGMTTPCAAVSALTVSRPSEGWQSATVSVDNRVSSDIARSASSSPYPRRRRRPSGEVRAVAAKPVRAVIYARISDDTEGRAAGVERQVEDCRALAERLGWTLCSDAEPILIDNDISASTRSKARRPAFDRLLAGVAAGEYDGILYYSNSRLTRRPREYETIIEAVESTGVRLASVASGTADLTTADGRMLGRILAAQDAAEAERIGERVTRALQQRRDTHGRPSPIRRSFGYAAGGEVVVPGEADAI